MIVLEPPSDEYESPGFNRQVLDVLEARAPPAEKAPLASGSKCPERLRVKRKRATQHFKIGDEVIGKLENSYWQEGLVVDIDGKRLFIECYNRSFWASEDDVKNV